MDQVSYANGDPVIGDAIDGGLAESRPRRVGATTANGGHAGTPGNGHADDPFMETVLKQAVGEQLAEQRLIRDALTEFDRRLEHLERDVVDRLEHLDRASAERVDRLERTVTERVSTFEAVLRRIVDRLATIEERVLDTLDHAEAMNRTNVEGLRSAIDASTERLAETVEHNEETTRARVDAIRPTVEAAVLGSVSPELDRTLDELRGALDGFGRRLQRDVNRLGYLMKRGGEPIRGFVPVDDDAAADIPEADAEAEPEAEAKVIDLDGEAGDRRDRAPTEAGARPGDSARTSKRRKRPLRARP